MKLLTFAHRGEAQSFIQYYQLKAMDDAQSFYQKDQLALLITGEGPYQSFTKLGPLLGAQPVSELLNIGIAGALDSTLNIDELYPIRTVYGFESEKPLFHSYTTDNASALDCITSWNRVVDDQSASKLRAFAPIVDREAWAQGNLCQGLKINFRSFKLISDYAGDETLCFDIKLKAKYYSDLMLEKMREIIKTEKDLPPARTITDFPFHASFTQKKRIQKLSQIQGEQKALMIIAKSESAQDCIQQLENSINPLQFHIKERLEEIKRPFENIGAKIITDPKLEKNQFQLRMDINSQKNIDNLTHALKNFSYSEFQDFWDGKLDV